MDLRSSARFSAIFLISCLTALGLAACNDDPGQSNLPDVADSGPSGDTAEDPDTGGDGDTGTMADAADTDDGADGGADTGAADTGDGSADGGMDGGPMDTMPTDTSAEQDGGGDTAMADSSSPDVPNYDVPPNPDALPMQFGPGSFIDQLKIKKTCCADYDSDPNPDNAIARMLDQVGALGQGFPDVQQSNMNINQRIRSGDLVILFEYGGWTNVRNQPSLDMSALAGESLGSQKYNIKRSSYYGANGQPKSQFATASVSNGQLTATGGSIVLPLDFGNGLSVTLRLQQPQLQATVDVAKTMLSPSGGVYLKSGTIAGIVAEKDIFDALNNLARKQGCSCMQGNQVFTPAPGDSYQCNTSCSGGSQLCGGLCQLVPGFIENYADQDLRAPKGAGMEDAFTFGATFTAEGAEFVKIVP